MLMLYLKNHINIDTWKSTLITYYQCRLPHVDVDNRSTTLTSFVDAIDPVLKKLKFNKKKLKSISVDLKVESNDLLSASTISGRC
jgi:hypothetical protein